MPFGDCSSCGRDDTHIVSINYWDRKDAKRYSTPLICYECANATKEKLKESDIVSDVGVDF